MRPAITKDRVILELDNLESVQLTLEQAMQLSFALRKWLQTGLLQFPNDLQEAARLFHVVVEGRKWAEGD